MRCLVIDDSSSCRELIERLLQRSGYRAQLAGSGEEALQALGEGEVFDVALVDMGLPGLCGAELIHALRETAPDMHILIVSSFDDRHHVLSALDAGAEGYVLKSELTETLGSSLQEVFAGKSPLSTTAASILLRHVRGRIDPPAPHKKRIRLADASGEIFVGKGDANSK
jgi:DNA-binding NarL/FixJ family response regulator